MVSVGVIGYGVVGKAVSNLGLSKEISVYPFDPNSKYCLSNDHKKAYNSDFVFVCVPTPSLDSGELDTSNVFDVARTWKDNCENSNSILVIKSTVPPGTTDSIIEDIGISRVIFNPEFLSQKTASEDFILMDEIILGGSFCYSKKLQDLYTLWITTCKERDDTIKDSVWADSKLNVSFDFLSSKEAELVKIARNSFYGVKLSFMNEVYDLAEKIGIDYNNFVNVFARSKNHSWINPNHTKVPGSDGTRGFGGACLPKDILGLKYLIDTNNLRSHTISGAVMTNHSIRNKINFKLTKDAEDFLDNSPVKKLFLTLEENSCREYQIKCSMNQDFKTNYEPYTTQDGVYSITIDPEYSRVFDGQLIDYQKGSFVFVNNDKVSSCGCGKSFSLKVLKNEKYS